MNRYDFAFFDQPINRCGTACEKWDGLMEREKRDLLPMWVADMDFRSAHEITEALVCRAQHPVYGYTAQTDAAVDATLGFYSRRHGLTLTREQQALIPCVVTGLRTAVRTLTAPGDGVLIQPPVYGPFFDSIRQNGRVLVENPLVADRNGRYSMDLNGMEDAFRGGVKLAMLCNPHNPAARVWTREEMGAVYSLCKRYGVTLIVDEIHEDFVYAPGTFQSALTLDESDDAKIIVLTSAGKTFNLAGLQQGVMLTRNQAYKDAIVSEMKRAGVTAGNIFALAATEAAYCCGDEWLDGLLAYLNEAHILLRAELAAQLPEAVMTPQEATYLAWIDLRAYGLSTDELMKRTHECGVAFTPGQFFGKAQGEGFLRINFGCPHSQTREAVNRLTKAIKQQ
ncbi:MAG TPA: MalY/PatB family protein [Candidatus Limiplasma sp.]|nr:MalY/PatB family protein [Candidatus Limiplasma sp.]